MYKILTGIALAMIMTVSMSSNVSADECCRRPVRNTAVAVASVPVRVVQAWQEAKPIRTVSKGLIQARPVRSLLGRVRGRVRGCCR
jgi:hypothetical protein